MASKAKNSDLVLIQLFLDRPLGNVKTMEQLVAERMAGDRFHTVLLAGFAAVALLLAAVGATQPQIDHAFHLRAR